MKKHNPCINMNICVMCREESEVLLKEVRVTLEEEQTAARERLEAQKTRDIERRKAELEEELETEKKRLQRERKEKLDSLKQEVTVDAADFFYPQTACLYRDI